MDSNGLPKAKGNPQWDWGAFNGAASADPAEDLDKLAALGFQSVVVRDCRLNAYLPFLLPEHGGMRLASIVFYLREVLTGRNSISTEAKRLSQALEIAGEYGADGVIVVGGVFGKAPSDRRRWHDMLEELLWMASPPPDGPPVLLEPMAAHLEDLFMFPAEVRSFVEGRLPGAHVKFLFDTYQIAAVGLDVIAEWDRLGSWTGHIHLSDFIPGVDVGRDRELPGKGRLPFKELLRRIGPACGMSLTLEAGAGGQSFEDSIRYLNDCVEDMEKATSKQKEHP